MSRGALKIVDGGFPIYAASEIRKVNAMRIAKSLPDVYSPIVPTKGQALFTTAESMNHEPASCYNCQFYTGAHCSLIGPRLPIRKLTYPREATADAKPIEYWPCCSMHLYGEPKGIGGKGTEDPDYLDLIWINAPKPGQEQGGANCGGCDGGDDCDHYSVEGRQEKWESSTGFCRALQTTVACGDLCTLWSDDDELEWREAVRIIGEQDGTS